MKTRLVIILVITILIAIISITSPILYKVTYPTPASDVSNLISTKDEYLKNIYTSSKTPNKKLSDIVKTEDLNWLWETAPKEMLEKFDIAENLSFAWPPPKGSRFKMTAFPYPDVGTSNFWLFQFIKGMQSLLDNTADQVTFPGWQISIYDPMSPNINSWQSYLSENFSDNQLKPFGIQTNPIAMEVTHSCYAPPNKQYPTCDDGGYWLYGTNGSGVFWTSCGQKSTTDQSSTTGKCLVANNKIDAIFKLWRYAQKLIKDGNPKGELALGLAIEATNKKVGFDSKPEEYITTRLKGTGGGLNLMSALKTVIQASKDGKQIPNITAWRSMEPTNAKSMWFSWLSLTTTLIVLFIAGIVGLFYAIVKAIINRKSEKWWQPTLLILGIVVALMIYAVIAWKIEWNVNSENLFEKFGYTTLDMALKKSELNVTDFVFSCAGLDKSYNDIQEYNPITNGFAQTQVFDFDLSYMTSILGIDSVIMHTQPNKSGSWAVEILDVRNTPVDTSKVKSLDDLIFKLGLCGQPIDKKVADRMPALLQGPIESSSDYFGYVPTAPCNCDESEVSKEYNDGKGKLKKCVFCKNSLSEKLC